MVERQLFRINTRVVDDVFRYLGPSILFTLHKLRFQNDQTVDSKRTDLLDVDNLRVDCGLLFTVLAVFSSGSFKGTSKIFSHGKHFNYVETERKAIASITHDHCGTFLNI